MTIGLVMPGRNPDGSAADREAPAALLAKGLLSSSVILPLMTAMLRSKDPAAEVMQEPVGQPYDVRECAFCGSAGIMLRFSRPAEHIAADAQHSTRPQLAVPSANGPWRGAAGLRAAGLCIAGSPAASPCTMGQPTIAPGPT